MLFHYCPLCGDKLTSKIIGDEGLVPFCPSCNRPFFNFSYPCVIVAVVNEFNEIALIKQDYLTTAHWILIAGYHSTGETAETTAAREVFEEIGIEVTSLRYVKSYHHETKDQLMLGFIAKAQKADFKLSGEVNQAQWVSLTEAEQYLRHGSIAHQLATEARLANS